MPNAEYHENTNTLRHSFTYSSQRVLPMDRIPLISIEERKERIRWNGLICFLLTLGNLCILLAVIVLLLPDSRTYMIRQYNEAVSRWDEVPANDRNFGNFSVLVNDVVFPLHQITQPHGSHYIYRDHRQSRHEPSFLEASADYYTVSIPVNAREESLSIIISDPMRGVTTFNRSVDLMQVFLLPSTSIHCNSGLKGSCEKRCHSFLGEWIDKKCVVTGYFHDLCLRLRPSSENYLDNPPELSLSGYYSETGCEHHTNREFYYLESSYPWTPAHYYLDMPTNITITLRHYRDPYIRAGVLTMGCTSLYEVDHDCFGNPPLLPFELQIGILLIASIALVIDLVLFLLYHFRYQDRQTMPPFFAYLHSIFDGRNDFNSEKSSTDLPLEEKVETPITPLGGGLLTPCSLISESSEGDITPQSMYDPDLDVASRKALLSYGNIHNRYQGDLDGI